MSKLSQYITAKQTGRTAIVEKPFKLSLSDVDIDVIEGDPKFDNYKEIYRVTVTLGAQCMISRYDTEGIEYEYVLDYTKKLIIEEAYGEFREDFMLIRQALLKYDVKKAHALLDNMYGKMFNE